MKLSSDLSCGVDLVHFHLSAAFRFRFSSLIELLGMHPVIRRREEGEGKPLVNDDVRKLPARWALHIQLLLALTPQMLCGARNDYDEQLFSSRSCLFCAHVCTPRMISGGDT
jgi:hypothetical protein